MVRLDCIKKLVPTHTAGWPQICRLQKKRKTFTSAINLAYSRPMGHEGLCWTSTPNTCHLTTITSGRTRGDTGRELAHFCLKCTGFLCETCAHFSSWLPTCCLLGAFPNLSHWQSCRGQRDKSKCPGGELADVSKGCVIQLTRNLSNV